MAENEKLVAKAPRKTAAVWAADKKLPRWHAASAAMVVRLGVSAEERAMGEPEVTENEFDQAAKRALCEAP